MVFQKEIRMKLSHVLMEQYILMNDLLLLNIKDKLKGQLKKLIN